MNLKLEIAEGNKYEKILKGLQPLIDETSEELYAVFVNSDPSDDEGHRNLVLSHKILLTLQQKVQSIIDTGRLAEQQLATKE